MNSKITWIAAIGIVGVCCSFFVWNPFEARIDYNREVKPILNKHCLKCHGGVKKAANVSFLFEEDIYKPAKSGKIPVVAGDADGSEMMRRILSHDTQDRMPKNSPPLSESEIQILRNWIDQGARWGDHWAYRRVERPSVPRGWFSLMGFDDNDDFVTNDIDYFTLAKLRDAGLTTAPVADRATLIRRVSLDITGLPPTDAEVVEFVSDSSADAYAKLVDRLLGSPAYGERWAAMWLDLARYADTKGYERDPGRSIWRYRDWLIKAFNDDKPYDTFTTEQLAGDLLPNRTDDNMIATGFHRNTMNNDEGGTVDEEFRNAALIDRVNTTWEVWQGTTFGCVQCHSHPYDPIRHEDYYKYLAFFNNTRDEDVTSDTPTLRFYESKDALKVATVEKWIKAHKASSQQLTDFKDFTRLLEPKINSHDFDQHKKASLLDAKYFGIKDSGSARLKNVTLTNKNRLLIATGTGADNAILRLRLSSINGPVIASVLVPKAGSDSVKIVPLKPTTGKHNLYWTCESPTNPEAWIQVKWVAFQESLAGSEAIGFNCVEDLYADLLTGSQPSTPVLVEGAGDLARPTHVFVRGNWTIKGAMVKPDVPQAILAMTEDLPKNRLGLAQWITHRDNPLTARVLVNRLWEQLFGTGIVETVEDFGSQGITPTHQELLDWLAVELMEEHGWSVKKLLRQIVLSGTYKQSATVTPQKLAQDPYNKLLSRGARVRLSAEQVRDQALTVSGLLSHKMYGPSVMPPQPEGIWLSPYDGGSWKLSEGEDRYRRGLYTYWKRTAPYPSMVAFDAPSREFCQSRRIRTNTPLQALVTLNDPVYLEAAHCLAERMMTKQDIHQKISEGYRLLLHKPLPTKRLKILEELYKKTLIEYSQNPQAAQKLLAFGGNITPEKAALTITANVLLNLDEVVNKE
jgi:Protein of unknown function (DUF1553)/Protein of unknown function (DUF1549)/Planctomycete cytochrome C